MKVKKKKKKKNWTMPILLLSTVASMMLQWGEIMKKRWRQKMIGAMMLLVMPSVMHKENVKVIKRKPSSSAC